MNRIKTIFLMLVFASALTAGYAFYEVSKPLNLSEDAILTLEKGAPAGQFFRKMESFGWIGDSRWIRLWLKITRQSAHIHAGDYRISPGMSTLGVLDIMLRGKTVQYQITLVEGQRLSDALLRMKNNEKIIYDLPPVNELMAFLNLPGHYEGRFYPDTYLFSANTRASEILRNANAELEKVLAEEWQNRAENLPYKTPEEALTMASIVEKETAVAEERSTIAGVFIRRLQQGMRLQTDPTVIYGLGEGYAGNITRQHLLTTTPYNTYRINGLPPTPIALVSRAAIHAALHPDTGNSLYFVAKGDGHHYFSATLEEHNKAVREYQIKRRSETYRSTPVK